MISRLAMTGTAMAALLSLAACGDTGGNETTPTSAPAKEAAGKQTIGAGLGDASKFGAAVKATGLDGTLAGIGPYTVLVPNDAAFDKLPAGAVNALMKDDARAELTGVLTYHILPGTILAADIGKAIDVGKGKTLLATMGGGTLTATRDGNAIVIADAAGTKARVTGAEEQKSNGVIHRIDAVLMPS